MDKIDCMAESGQSWAQTDCERPFGSNIAHFGQVLVNFNILPSLSFSNIRLISLSDGPRDAFR